MSKKEQHSFSSTLSINPYKKDYIYNISNSLKKLTSARYNKNQHVISYLNIKEFITDNLSISKNISDEDIHDALCTKCYDELGLDLAIDYNIQYVETFNNFDENYRNFYVFIINSSTINRLFKKYAHEVKYIDYILPSALLFKSLYINNIIEDNDVECFIYFQENDTFITIYYKREFLYTKSINYSFLQMHERFCEIYGENIEYKDFISFLSLEDLKTTTSPYKLHIIKLYKEIFSNIGDILTYVKRALNIDKVNHIYIDSQIQTITKLHEISEIELSIKSSSFNFSYTSLESENFIDSLHYLMQIYTTLPENEKYTCNFTMFLRPPKFIHRESIKVIMLAAASVILAFLYPASYWALTYAQSLQHQQLQTQYSKINELKTARETIIKAKKQNRDTLLKLLNSEQQEYTQKKNTLVKIHDVKVNYPMKANLLYAFSKDFSNYLVHVQEISYKEPQEKNASNSKKELSFYLISLDDKNITGLLEHFTKTYEGKFNFFLDEITYESKSNHYLSTLKVSIL